MTWKPHIRQTNYQMNVCFVKHQCGVGEMIISNQTCTTTKSSLDEGERRIPYFSPVVPIKTISKCGAPPTCTCCPDDWWHVSDGGHHGRVLLPAAAFADGRGFNSLKVEPPAVASLPRWSSKWSLLILHVTPPARVLSACCVQSLSHRGNQLCVRLLKVLRPVRLWRHPELRPHAHGRGAPRPGQVPPAGWYEKPDPHRRRGDGATSGPLRRQHACQHILRSGARRQPGWLRACKALFQISPAIIGGVYFSHHECLHPTSLFTINKNGETSVFRVFTRNKYCRWRL